MMTKYTLCLWHIMWLHPVACGRVQAVEVAVQYRLERLRQGSLSVFEPVASCLIIAHAGQLTTH